MKQNDVHVRYFVSVLGLLVLAALGCGSGTPSDDRTIGVSADDKEMSEAIATARRTLPEFWSAYARDGKMVGNHTVRPLLKTMPPEEAARIKAMMESP